MAPVSVFQKLYPFSAYNRTRKGVTMALEGGMDEEFYPVDGDDFRAFMALREAAESHPEQEAVFTRDITAAGIRLLLKRARAEKFLTLYRLSASHPEQEAAFTPEIIAEGGAIMLQFDAMYRLCEDGIVRLRWQDAADDRPQLFFALYDAVKNQPEKQAALDSFFRHSIAIHDQTAPEGDNLRIAFMLHSLYGEKKGWIVCLSDDERYHGRSIPDLQAAWRERGVDESRLGAVRNAVERLPAVTGSPTCFYAARRVLREMDATR